VYFNIPQDIISSQHFIYADDFKLVRTINSEQDCILLQEDLLKFINWCDTKSLCVNPAKCAVLTVTNKTYPVVHNYNAVGTDIPRVNEFRDLGIKFDSNLKLDVHIDTIVKKGYKMLGFLIRTAKYFQNIHTVVTLYKSLVRPQLEYGTVVWSPHTISMMNKVEKIQRRTTRFIFKKFRIPYAPYDMRTKILELDTLARRRDISDGVVLHKLYNGVMVSSVTSSICVRRNIYNIINMKLFAIKKYTLNTAYHSPLPRMLCLFNQYINRIEALNGNLYDFKQKLKLLISQRNFN